MLAITISCSRMVVFRAFKTRLKLLATVGCASGPAAVLTALLLGAPAISLAQSPPSLERAREVLAAAQARHKASPTNAAAAWESGRAAFELCEFARTKEERAEIAKQGITASRAAVKTRPDVAAGYLYLALNLGQLARTKTLGALKLVHEMEELLIKSVELDPAFDHARATRTLGMLYMEAPQWPVSIGNRAKARAHLESAVRQSPRYPGNHVVLAEAYARWHEGRNLEKTLKDVQDLLPAARTEFPVETWAANWSDWESRIEKLQGILARMEAAPPASSSERGATKKR